MSETRGEDHWELLTFILALIHGLMKMGLTRPRYDSPPPPGGSPWTKVLAVSRTPGSGRRPAVREG